MKAHANSFVVTKTSKIIFILSIIIAVYWLLGWTVNVYSQAVMGAIFELAWLPVMLLTFTLPIVSFILLIKDKFNLRSLHLYSILIIVLSIVAVRLVIS